MWITLAREDDEFHCAFDVRQLAANIGSDCANA
jgi:hypothetical protein